MELILKLNQQVLSLLRMSWVRAAVGMLATLFLILALVKGTQYITILIDPWNRSDWQESDAFYFNMEKDVNDLKVAWGTGRSKLGLVCVPEIGFWRTIKLTNYGSKLISSSNHHRPGKNKEVNFAYRLFRQDETEHFVESRRFFLNQSLVPVSLASSPSEETVSLYIDCSHLNPGKYRLSIQAVQEAIGWQSDFGDQERWIEDILVVTTPENLEAPFLNEKMIQSIQEELSRNDRLSDQEKRSLNQAFQIATAILASSLSETYFKGSHYISHTAGSNYPMVWTRDMATIQQAWPIIFKPNVMASFKPWFYLFFAFQSKNGSIPDWVSPSGKVLDLYLDKNTIQSDQELWTVFSVLNAIKSGWLVIKNVTSKDKEPSLLQPLSSALNFLVKNRWDTKRRCFWTGHIADWGDVDLRGKDHTDSTKMSNQTVRVCSTFINSLAYLVISDFLSWVAKTTESQGRDVIVLQDILVDTKKYVLQALWNESKGYFRIHNHIDPYEHDFDEDEIFALVGNIGAITAGIASERQSEKILMNMLNRKEKYQASTSSAVLLPSYPPGTYENEIMDEAYEYQNGGQWDWFGPSACYQLAKRDKTKGLKCLTEIGDKVLYHGSFHEWESLDGRVAHQPHFRAGAASFIIALHKILKEVSR